MLRIVLRCADQISVVTWYGFTATVVILVMPLVTEFYELRKFMLERASVEPGFPVDVDTEVGQVGADSDDTPAAAAAASAGGNAAPLKPMIKGAASADQSAAADRQQKPAIEISVNDVNASQTDTV